MDRIKAMELFVRVSESGSFGAAAAAMHVSRPVVTAAIQELEARVGTRLLSRTTRHVELTADGVGYFERCQRLLAELDETEALFRTSQNKPRGRLRVDMPTRVARMVVIPRLHEFFERYPQVQLELGASDRPLDLINDGVDCVVRVGAARDPRLEAVHLGHLDLCTCASPRYLEQHGTPQSLEDLAQHFAVNYATSFHGEVQSWSYLDRGVCKSVLLRSRVTVNNVEAYIASAIAGLGLIQLPTYDVRSFTAPGTLVEVMQQWPTQGMPVVLLYPKRRYQTQLLLLFIEWVRAVLDASMLKPAPGVRARGART